MLVPFMNRPRRFFNLLVIFLFVPLAAGPLAEQSTSYLSAAEKQSNQTTSTTIELPDELRTRCLTILRNGMRSTEFWPSIHAAEALTLAGEGDEVRRHLEPKLQTETDDQKLCGIARELVRAGDRAKASILLNILAKENDHGHVHAAESLYKIGEIGDGRLLRAAMTQSEKPTLQVMAAAALGRNGSPEAMKILRRLASGEDSDVRRLTAWVLARIGDESDIPPLQAELLQSDDALFRSYFEHALAALGDRQGEAVLAGNLQNENATIRTFAAVFAGEARITSTQARLIELLDDATPDVRYRAAQSLLLLSQRGPESGNQDISIDLFRATKENPRYSEGDVIELQDGTLLCAVTEFFQTSSDFAKARIIGKTSRDGGRSWSEPRVLQENVGGLNTMSVTFQRLAHPAGGDAPLGMFYLIKNAYNDLHVHLRISNDEAKTFGAPILVTSEPGYHVLNNDRVTLLSSGRLLVPVAATADVRKENHFLSYCYLSDDGGKTWRLGKGRVDFAKRGAMEPETLELNGGRILMIVRTQLGYIGAAFSSDGGDTWSEAASWNVTAPEAPSTLRRIPATGDLLLIWNNTFKEGVGHGGKRTPLTAAVSSDEGRTWKLVRNLEDRDDETYSYTSVTFVRDRVLLSYYVNGNDGRYSTRFRSLPTSWFYQQGK